MTKTLEERAAVVVELGERFTEEWFHTNGDIWYVHGYIDVNGELEPGQALIGNIDPEVGDFIAHAPRMAQLIADQQKRIERLTSELSNWKKEI